MLQEQMPEPSLGKKIEQVPHHSLKIENKVEKVCRLEQLHVDKIEYKPAKRKESNY